MKRRHDRDICADILRVSTGGAKKAQIVYRANLNSEIVKGYLRRLIDNGMLALTHEPQLFTTTTKGVDFLNQYCEIMTIADFNGKAGHRPRANEEPYNGRAGHQ